MRDNKINLIFTVGFMFIALTIMSSACKKITDLYLGVNQQPKIDNNPFQEGLNIFGIIRPDFTAQYNNSFVHVQQVFPALTDSTTDYEITDAQIIIFSSVNKETDFVFSNLDVFTQSQYRPITEFMPQAGETYRIECTYKNLPKLLATTTVPQPPVILEHNINSSHISLTLKNDASIFLYEVYVYDQNFVEYQRFVPESDQPITAIFLHQTSSGTIFIYSFDQHLATYYITSNTALNFNKYRQAYSLVENGYGVFGSLNLSILSY